jgi:RNA polymerase sigma factor (sigma-70 family)
MKECEQLFNQIADEYSLVLLNWAYKKLGDRAKAEDLAQEVLLQVFSAIKREISVGNRIERLENLVWKVAHYVWCHYLRQEKVYKMCVPVDDLLFRDSIALTCGTDFAADYAEKEHEKQMIARMRKQIANLSYLQREIMICFYIDKLTVRQIAEKLNTSEQAVKWHLFDTRKKLKREITEMKNSEYVYRPLKLHMAISGQAFIDLVDTKKINESLTKQNICIACYEKPKTLDELTEILGIPKAYIEYDLQWLTKKEFVSEEKGRYSTTFVIEDTQSEQGKYAVYLKHKEKLSDVILEELIAAADKIRSINFYGSDKPLDKLLWFLIYRLANYIRIPYMTEEPPIRPDGGKYFPLGFDNTDFDTIEKALDTSGWAYNGAMCNQNFWWFGLYNFGQSEIQDLINGCSQEWQNLRALLCRLKNTGYTVSLLNENDKFGLAKLVEKGFVSIEDNKVTPSFCIFTSEQYRQLEQTVFEPLAIKIADEVKSLADDLSDYFVKIIPPHLKRYQNLFVKFALYDIGYLTTIFAFNAGKLYVPKDSRDGEFLTLMYIKP